MILRHNFTVLILASVALCAVPFVSYAQSNEPEPSPWAITAFGGQMTNEVWFDIPKHPQDIDFADVGLIGLGASYQFKDFSNGLVLEVEGQVVKYVGEQDNWEFNLPLVARWTRFPWSKYMRSSAAFGLGLSWAASTPEYEVIKEEGSEQLLAYWMLDFEVGPKDSNWSLIGRLHHRSVSFGVFGESGGANSLVVGAKYHFD